MAKWAEMGAEIKTFYGVRLSCSLLGGICLDGICFRLTPFVYGSPFLSCPPRWKCPLLQGAALLSPEKYVVCSPSLAPSAPMHSLLFCFHTTLFIIFFFFFSFIYISWRLITLQYCNGLCHTVIWISHGFTCVPHPEPTTLHCKTQLESWPLPQIAYLPFWSHALFPLLLLGVIPEYRIEE